jgi:hypothetical protein
MSKLFPLRGTTSPVQREVVILFAPSVRDLPMVSSLRSVGFAELAGVYPAKRVSVRRHAPQLLRLLPRQIHNANTPVTHSVSTGQARHSYTPGNYIIKIRTDLLAETDGPMLRYGIQSLNNAKLILPLHKIHWPDKERLARRYLDFLKAG